jgi:hypothetical protein
MRDAFLAHLRGFVGKVMEVTTVKNTRVETVGSGPPARRSPHPGQWLAQDRG